MPPNLAVLLLVSTVLVSSYPHNHTKRWFSVQQWDRDTTTEGPWPSIPPGSNSRPLRYCYEREKDYVNLKDMVEAAIRVWQPAFDVSGLTIVPDKGSGLPEALCSEPEIRADALRIRDVTDPSEQEIFASSTSIGWSETEPSSLRFERLDDAEEEVDDRVQQFRAQANVFRQVHRSDRFSSVSAHAMLTTVQYGP